MYAYIRGKVVKRLFDSMIIDNQGIGYRIQASPGVLDRLPSVGEEAMVHTHLYVREDAQALFGFPSAEDLNLFELLLTVSGIGPKVASMIVGSFTPSQFALAVITGDAKALTQVRGIGRKGAERLILELKDKLKSADFPESANQSGLSGQTGVMGQSLQTEAVSALLVLGYSGSEATQAIKVVFDPERSLEDLIRLALRQLMR